MEENKGVSKEAFDRARQQAAGDAAPSANGAMALVIDIQGVASMDERDAKAYLDKLGESIEALRANNIPVTWVTMGRTNRLYEPQTPSGSPAGGRDMAELREAGFTGIDPGEKGRFLFQQFLKRHGPRTNEAIYVKSHKSALIEAEDRINRPRLDEVLAEDFKEGVPIPSLEAEGNNLVQHLRERDVRNLLVLGAVSTNCVAETASWAQIKGFKPTIGIDGILSWQGLESEVNPQTSRLIWRGDEEAPEALHREKITARAEEIVADDRREINDPDREAIRHMNMATVEDYIAAVTTPAPAITPRPAANPANARSP